MIDLDTLPVIAREAPLPRLAPPDAQRLHRHGRPSDDCLPLLREIADQLAHNTHLDQPTALRQARQLLERAFHKVDEESRLRSAVDRERSAPW